MEWETAIGSTSDPPTFAQLTTFFTSRLRALETVEGASSSSASTTNIIEAPKQGKRTSVNSTRRVKAHATHTAGEGARKCLICQKDYFILFCPTFKRMNPRDRKQLVTEKRLCYNCLAPHSSQACKSTKGCQVCVGKHHTSLHSTFEQSSAARSSLSKQVPDSSRETIDDPQQEPSASVSEKVTHYTMTSCSVTCAVSVILATAELMLESDQERRAVVRALIDPCSEVSLMEESVAQILNLKRVPEKIPIIGVGKTQTYTNGRVSLRIFSRLDQTISYRLTAYVLPKLPSYQAAKSSCPSVLDHLEGLELADPDFLSSRHIDLILGADIYAQIIRAGLKPPNGPVAQATSLGWILTGPLRQTHNLNNNTNLPISLQCSMRESDLVETLTRFWKIEEIPAKSNPLTED
ncbi:uncharacterized protein LOC114882407 [Osmia bicornis bicornis]|uniref:uncharacterized protein LOC114882407 n=1 Tax=Osmia bicornis bicornis TaxID=1437191 RepID=UPI001EAF3A54|nr:uncharacterized protein LOC114882407 [Osmia bicornis bicornis]